MWIKALYHSFLNLIYPPSCLHCQSDVTDQEKLFCHECLTLLDLIDPLERCPYCFNAKESLDSSCVSCKKSFRLFKAQASCFDYEGPAMTLIQHLKSAHFSYLAEGVGAFMVAQFVQVNWPMPDVIVPVPLSFLRKFNRGFNQCRQLANQVSKLLKIPVCDVLVRKEGSFSQDSLTLDQRKELKKELFSIKNGSSIEDKRVLLIDDLWMTGTTLKCCAEILIEENPNEIYGLTVCRAIS